MSLLNDALKAAEERQGRPAPSAYTGQGAGVTGHRRRTGTLALVLILLVAVAVIAYFYLLPAPAPVPEPAEANDAPKHMGAITAAQEPQDVNVGPAVVTLLPSEGAAPASRTEQNDGQAVESEPTLSAVEASGSDEHLAESVAPEQPATADVRDRTPQDRAERPSQVPESRSEPGPASESDVAAAPRQPVREGGQGRSEPEKVAETSDAGMEKQSSTSNGTANGMKQPRQSPEQLDRNGSEQVRKLLSRGDVAAAERIVADLTAAQDAPSSRYALARGVLARGNVQGALSWIPAELALDYPDLRLIRARALLAGGDLEQALATLQQNVPPVADHVEYRVTLATLLQQWGDSNGAANHWAELIAWNDSRAPWWVGLAIALESRGDAPAARRAYEQAAALPGLAPSLADYVRQRLQLLGAG